MQTATDYVRIKRFGLAKLKCPGEPRVLVE